MPVYGDQQAFMTMNRAAYGDVPAAMMSGAGTVYGGAMMGAQNMASDIGRMVMPVTYTPPARMYVGNYGFYQQHMGMMQGIASMAGVGPDVPRGTTQMEYGMNVAGDVGERFGAGMAAVANVGVSSAFGATVGRFAGMGAGAALGAFVGMPGVGAAVGGFVGTAAGYMASETVIGQAIEQRRGIQSFLENTSFRFVGAGSGMSDPRLGGMNRQARQQTAEFIRGMDIKDSSLSTEDLSGILQGSTQLGLLSGAGDMEGFQKRFKDITESVKTVSKVLHQTLEDGLKTIRDLRAVGIDPSQVSAIVQQADAFGKTAGRTGAEMIGLGLQGAEMFRGTGISMGIGFQQNMMNVAAIRATRDAGVLSNEAIAQMGGEEAAAQRMTASSLGFTQSAFGRGFNAAFFNSGMGGPGFNQGNFMNAMLNGGGDFIGNTQAAAGNLSSPANLIKYQANQEKFISEMGKTFGGMGLQIGQMGAAASYATYMARSTGADPMDAMRLALKEQGLSGPEIDARMAQMEGRNAVFGANQAGASATRDKMVLEQAHENFIGNRIGARIGDTVKSVVDYVARPANRLIDASAEAVTGFYEEQMLGVQRADVRGINLGMTTAADRANAFGGRRRGVDLDRGAWFAKSAGEDLARAINSGAFAGLGITSDDMKSGAEVALNDGFGISRNQLDKIENRARVFTMTADRAKEMQTSGALDKVEGGVGSALLGGKLSGVKDTEGLLQATFGKGMKDVTEAEMGKLLLETKGTRFEGMLDATRRNFLIGKNAGDAAGVQDLKLLREDFDTDKKKLAESLGFKGELTTDAAQKIAMAAVAGDDATKKALLADAAKIQLQSGSSEADVQKMIHNAESGGLAVGTASQHLRETTAAIGMSQKGRSGRVVADMIEQELGTDRFKNLKSEEFQQIVAAADSMRTIGILSSDEEKVLKDHGVAAGYFKKKQSLDNIRAVAKDKDANIDTIRKSLAEQGLSGDKLTGALKKIMGPKGGINQGGLDDVINELETDFSSSMAGATGIGAAGGSPASVDGQQATAAQVFAQQTNINTQVLAVMQGLASKLNVR